jgi:hypothetical protein
MRAQVVSRARAVKYLLQPVPFIPHRFPILIFDDTQLHFPFYHPLC